MNRLEIEAARKAGILDDAKAAQLEAFLRAGEDPGAASDNESLRFLANFNDIFISIGLVLLAIGLSIGSGLFLGSTGSVLLIVAPVIIVLWALLEYFAGRRRLLLPSMTLSLLITGMAMMLAAIMASGFGNFESIEENFIKLGLDSAYAFGFWASAGALAASGLIYSRFRLPFSLFLMAVAIAVGLYTFAFSEDGFGSILSGMASFLIGLGTLAAAIFFDARDPQRKSLSSDNAFWLHFAAAPQVMLGLRAIFSGGTYGTLSPSEAGALLLALAGFSILSLALNRRALIAAAVFSFWLALGALVESTGGDELSNIVWTLVLLGGMIVLLGAGWKTARRLVLTFIPKTGFFARIFPPEPA